MLVLDGKTDLNQISLTGVRALTMIGLLAVAPRSIEEIRQKFLELKIMDESHSDDILRIDLNTIKLMGCEIDRCSNKTGYKYILRKHPFLLPVGDDTIKALKRLFDKIEDDIDLYTLIEYDKLIRKIGDYISDDSQKEKFLGLSPLIRYDTDKLFSLLNRCHKGYTLDLLYKKPTLKKPSNKKVIADKIILKNDKIYLYGYRADTKEPIMLNFKHIVEILSSKNTNIKVDTKRVRVVFHIKDYGISFLEDDEKILETYDNGYLIEGNYFNEFVAMQRVLSLGSKCTVKEPSEFKNNLILKLKEMRKIYEKET